MMTKKKKKVPNLRFKGFTDDWEQCKLGNIGKARSGVGFPNKEQGGRKGIPFFKVSDMNNQGNEFEMVTSNNYVTATQILTKKWKPISKVPAVIFAKVGAALMLNRKRLVKTPFLIDNNTMAYIFDRKWDPYFGKNLFDTLYLPKYAQTGALPSFNGSDIESIQVMLPSLGEQQRISQVFKIINNLISLQQRKLELLKEIKKGLLQKMFADKDSKRPVLRFKGFHDDWEQRKLGELGEIITGNTPKTSEVENYDKFGIPWITPTDIHGSYTLTSFKRLSNIGEKKAKLAPANSILVTCIASIGKNTLIRQRSAFNQQINALIPINNDSSFLLAASYNWSKRMVNLAGQTSMQIINKNTFSRLNTTVPSLSEQQAIGNLFSQINNLISLQHQKLAKYQSIKKSLLQQMFLSLIHI